jgi:hypothetical protein
MLGGVTTRSSPFGDEPFAVSAGLRAGWGRGALAGVAFTAPFHGVRQWVDAAEPANEQDRLVRSCRQYAARMTAHQFFSHDTALVLHGAPTPSGWTGSEPHVSVHRPHAMPRATGIRGHRLQSRAPATWGWATVRVEHPARAWAQSVDWGDDDLVAAGDFLVARRRPLVSLAELRAEAAASRRARRLLVVVEQIRVGAESPRETRLRLVLVRAGLPEPELNVDIHDERGVFLGRGDLVHRRYRVLTEYDGRQHAESTRQFARDADRWYALERAGWRLVRVLAHHRPHQVVERVTAALTAAGWRP